MSFVPLPPPLVVAGSAFNRPANTTAYSFGQLVANSITAGSVTPSVIAAARGNDVAGTILKCRLQKSGSGITNAIFRLHLYNAAVTVSNGDGGTWLTTTSGYLGSMDVTVDKSFSDGALGIGAPTIGSTISFAPISGSQNINCLIEARAAYSPASGETFTPILEMM